MSSGDSHARAVAPVITPAATAGDGEVEVEVDVSREALHRLIEDRDHVARDLNDTLVHRLFSISLDLHAALSRIEHGAGHRGPAAEKIRLAIDGLDRAIQVLRNAVVDGDGLGAAGHDDL